MLLTSGGIQNSVLQQELMSLLARPVEHSRIAVVVTAANAEDEDKRWLIDDLARVSSLGFEVVDVVDFAGLPRETWLARLETADVLLFEGGSTDFLVQSARAAGLLDDLERWKDTKVYVGVSAGSIMACEVINPQGTPGLGWVDFLVVPHMNASFRNRTRDDVQKIADTMKKTVYWLDDNAAVRLIDDEIVTVGSGESIRLLPRGDDYA